MDFYQSESEFIDSLDFLAISPQVTKVVNSRQLFGYTCNGEPNNVQLFRSFRNKFPAKTKGSENNKNARTRQRQARTIVKKGGESSTSLVLKKTSERKILKQYTVLSYTSLHSSPLNKEVSCSNHLDSKDKPLIKVTVIPKTDQTQTLRKRRHKPKRVQSTSSNQENSVKTKNLYLVIAGRRNKVYEIKTTGSATVPSDYPDSRFYKKDDLSIEGLSNIKHIIQSLDMDQKPKKVKKEHNIDDLEKKSLESTRHEYCQYESKGIDPYGFEGFAYTSNTEGGKRPLNKSRVRIYGQLGLTEDDRYVLRYGATVNDSPVTDFAQLTQDFLPEALPGSGYSPNEGSPEITREASVQATCGGYYRNQQTPICGFGFKKESQGTQVNFNISSLARNPCKHPGVDKNVQCPCTNVIEQSTIENRSGINPLKETLSPLVIISVYPKQSPEEIFKYSSENYAPDTRLSPDTRAQYVSTLKADKAVHKKTIETKTDESKDKKTITNKKYNLHSISNRSPSPTRRMLPENENKTMVLKTQAESKSNRYKGMRVIKNKILEKERSNPESPPTSKIAASTVKPIQGGRPATKTINPIFYEEKGTNTDHINTKKTLVDNYTKQMSSNISYLDKNPVRKNNSKVTINIEGEKEYYNVLLDQSKLSTDLTVDRKTRHIDQKRCLKNNMSPSLENLFLQPSKQIDARSMNNKRASGITIRDSLEISHRREEKQVSDGPKYMAAHSIENPHNNSEFIAPIKHYTGDDCSICDPVERDKQIRELLGVNKSSYFTSTSLEAHSFGIDECPLHCFYRRECERRQLAEINLVKYCPILNSISKLTKQTGCQRPCCTNTARNLEDFCDDYDDDGEDDDDINNEDEDEDDANGDDENENVCCDRRNTRELTLSSHSQQKSDNNQKPMDNTENSAIYQQLILNRNIQIFLQIEQFSKQRPIILSRKQYDKVKKTIQTTLCNKYKDKRKKYEERVSDTSVKEVRQRKSKDIKLYCNQQIQTEFRCCKNSCLRTNRRPRVISKVRYVTRVPKAKKNDSGGDSYQGLRDLGEYYQDYLQEVSKDNVEPYQKTCQAPLLYPRNYNYYRPSEKYFDLTLQKQYEQGYPRNIKCVTSNNIRKMQRHYDNYTSSAIAAQNICNQCEQYHILNENCHFDTEQHRKQNAQYRKEPKEHSNVKEKLCFEIGDHSRFNDRVGRESGEYRKSNADEKQNEAQSKCNKEFCKENREYCTVIRKYCVDCGERYKPNKECCKVVKEQRKLKDIIFKDTKRHTSPKESSKKNSKAAKKCKESGEPHTTELLKMSVDNHVTSDVCHGKSRPIGLEGKQCLISRHRAYGEHNIESERPRPLNVELPPAGEENQEGLPSDNCVHHNSHNDQNKEIHKINKIIGMRPAKKWDHYTPSNEAKDVILEDNKPFEEHNKTHIESVFPLETHEKSKREHVKYNAMLDKSLTAGVSHFLVGKYEERSRVPQDVYSDKSGGFQEYFKHDTKTEDYFGQNVKYCRLDVEHHIHTEQHKNSERHDPETKEIADQKGRYGKQPDNKEENRDTLEDVPNKQDNPEIGHIDKSTKKTVSSLEIHYTSVTCLKKLDSVKSDIAVHSDSSLCHVNSIQTIFRGHKKSPTPNLGTSMYSLYSEDDMNSNKSANFIMTPRDVKRNKRPFLRRLMSCLVMRSTKQSILKLPVTPAQEISSANSSVDSYHISSSFGAVEVTSSIYDTSASFYSNHTILPINSKIKRGFFNSVRGFLTNRKS